MGDAPREDLVRMQVGSVQYRADPEGGGGTLFGYAAVFDRWAMIDSWEGRFKERMSAGAFKKTLTERREAIKCLFNHGMDPSIGDKPLGKPRVMREDGKKGLYVEVPLDDTSYNRDIKASLASGALDGMSIRMTVVEDAWEFYDDKDPERTIRAIKLHEFGPVTFPAYEATQAGVRAHAPAAFRAWQDAHHQPVVPPRPGTEGTTDPHHAADGPQQRNALVADDSIQVLAADGSVLLTLRKNESGLFAAVAEEAGEESRDVGQTSGGDQGPDEDTTPDVEEERHEETVPAPTGGHAVPAQPPRHEPGGNGATTRERRALTLAYMDEWLANERTRTTDYLDRVEDFEAAAGLGN